MKKSLLTLFFPLLFFGQVFASHFVGSKLSYQCLNNGNYRIQITEYLDCVGPASGPYLPVSMANAPTSPLSNPSVTASCATPASSWTVVSYTEISMLCPSVVSACISTNPNAPAGYAELTFYRDYTVSSTSCTQFEVISSTCCRGSYITTISSSTSLYHTLVIPVDSGSCSNSSPQFLTNPRAFVCNRDTLSLNVSAFDPDGDSLFYEFYVPSTSANSTVSYFPGYSATQPMGANWYINLNSQTGELEVAGNGSSPETGVLAVRVKEFRNGVLLGSSSIEFQLLGQDCQPDDAPEARPVQLISGGTSLGPYGIQASPGLPLQFAITFEDDSAAQLIVEHGLDQQLPGSVTTQSGSNPLTLTVDWTPPQSFQGQTFYAGPTIADNNCPLPNNTYQPILFNMVPFTFDAVVTESDCQSPTGSIDLTVTGTQGNYQFLWNTGDTTEDLSNLSAGVYSVQITNSSGFVLNQSFALNSGNLQSNLSITPPACNGTGGALLVNPVGGVAPYDILWNTGSTANSLSNLGPGGYSVVITDSAGCTQIESLLLSIPDSCGSHVSGRVYFDADTSCSFGGGDVGTQGILVYSSQGFGTFTDSLGNYRLRVNPGTVSLGAQVVGDSTACYPLTYNLNLNLGDDTTGFDFPWYRYPVQDLRVTAHMSTPVPGFEATIWIMATNAGTVPVSGDIELNYDPQLAYVSAIPTETVSNPSQSFVSWNIGNLAPSQSSTIQAKVSVDSSLAIGTLLTHVVSILPIANDSFPINNVDTVSRNVRAAFDPNEKEVSPVGLRELGLIKTDEIEHEYLIRFQNVGNYPATNVLIRDTLDSDLLIPSLKQGEASDAYTLRVLPGGILEFYFENIFLPDSTSDPAGSMGFVSFSIEHDPSLPVGTQIFNRAGIYFDFNPPIITNRVVNTLYIQPELGIILNPNDPYCEGSELLAVVDAEGMAPYTYEWSTGDRDERVNDLQSTTLLDEDGWYVVTLLDSFGFRSIDSVQLDVTALPTIDLNWTVGPNGEFTFDAGNPDIESYEWTFGGNSSSTDVQPTVNVSGLDSLTVRLIASNSCGIDTLDTVILIATSIDATSVFGEVKLMPHPVKDRSVLRFDNPTFRSHSLRIYDVQGRTHAGIQFTSGNEFVVEKKDLLPGIYLYQLQREDGQIFTQRFVIR